MTKNSRPKCKRSKKVLKILVSKPLISAYLSYIILENVQNVHAVFNKSLASRGIKLHMACQALKFYLSSSIGKKVKDLSRLMVLKYT